MLRRLVVVGVLGGCAALGTACDKGDVAEKVEGAVKKPVESKEPAGSRKPVEMPPSHPPGPDNCGDGIVQTNEECDGLELSGFTCADVVPGTTGTLACKSGCTFDTSGCSATSRR